jgi:4-aminobutyrate aminotransferase-like enzyme
MATGSLLDRRHRVLGTRSPLFYDRPLQLVRGEGVWVYDETGRKYLDAYNNVPHVGHCHPQVVDALLRQATRINTHTRYLDECIVSYAERLTSSFDPALDMVIFTCTGSEANELALRIIRECSGGIGVICSEHAYHGNTSGVLPLSTLLTPPERRGPFIRTVPVMDPYRDRGGRSDQQLATDYAAEVQRAIGSFKEAGIPFAGLMFCSTFSGEGLPTLPPGYMRNALEHVHAAGGYFISDEVQSGFGRYGTHMWGHQRLDVVADLATLGKPMGNGHPVAAVVGRRELIERFYQTQGYFNTFAGNPVSAAVGMAVLDVLERERLLENAADVGQYTRERLLGLGERHAAIGDVRGGGLFIAVELVTDRKTKQPATQATDRVVNALREQGVLINRIGVKRNILKIRPPMVFTRAHADLLIDTLDDVLRKLPGAA